MPKSLAVPFKRFEGVQISPRDIIVDEDLNGRAFNYTHADIADLLADLRSGKGITTPVEIYPAPIEGGVGAKLKIGYRRHLAATEFLKENPDYLLPCVWGKDKDPLTNLEDNARENAHRKSLTVIDQGHVALRLQGEPTTTGGRTQAEIAEILNVSDSQVLVAIKLVTELSPALQKQVHLKNMTTSDALDLLKVPEERKAQTMEQVEQRLTAPSTGETPSRPPKLNVREVAQESGAKLTRRMGELRKYCQQAIDEDGPGSNKGEVALKGALLDWISGDLTDKQLDNRFQANCKVKG